MIQFICLFLPAFISLQILCKKENYKDLIDKIGVYSFYNVLINLSLLIIVFVNNNFEYTTMIDRFSSVSFVIKYLVIATILSWLYPLMINKIINLIKDNITIKFIVKK